MFMQTTVDARVEWQLSMTDPSLFTKRAIQHQPSGRWGVIATALAYSLFIGEYPKALCEAFAGAIIDQLSEK